MLEGKFLPIKWRPLVLQLLKASMSAASLAAMYTALSCRLVQGMRLLWNSPEITAPVETTSAPESWRQEALCPEMQQVPTHSLCSSSDNHSHAKLKLHCNMPPCLVCCYHASQT